MSVTKQDKFCAIYYPDCMVENITSLATFCLYCDELHLVTPSDFARDPTTYLKNLPDKVCIGRIGRRTPETSKIEERIGKFYAFALQHRPLLGKVVFYEPHLLSSQITKLVDQLLGDGLPVDELSNFLRGEIPEREAAKSFLNEHPEVNDEVLFRIVPTSLFLAKQNSWVLVGDRSDMPIPVFSETLSSVQALSSLLGEECLRLVMPACFASTSEDILEARDKLESELIPFRMTLCKLAPLLRSLLPDNPSQEDLKREARFLVQTTVEPALNDIRRRVELEKGRLWRRLFGAAIGWIPLIARAYTAPSPDVVYQAIQKASADMGSLLDRAHGVTMVKEPGLSFLLNVEQVMNKDSMSNP